MSEIRQLLCLKFAKKILKHEKAKDMFPLNNEPRNKDKYMVQFAKTGRLYNSSIPQMQRALNAELVNPPNYQV